MTSGSAEAPAAAPSAAQARTAPVLRSEDMLQGQSSVEILHAGARYRLSVTKMGKLILTK